MSMGTTMMQQAELQREDVAKGRPSSVSKRWVAATGAATMIPRSQALSACDLDKILAEQGVNFKEANRFRGDQFYVGDEMPEPRLLLSFLWVRVSVTRLEYPDGPNKPASSSMVTPLCGDKSCGLLNTFTKSSTPDATAANIREFFRKLIESRNQNNAMNSTAATDGKQADEQADPLEPFMEPLNEARNQNSEVNSAAASDGKQAQGDDEQDPPPDQNQPFMEPLNEAQNQNKEVSSTAATDGKQTDSNRLGDKVTPKNNNSKPNKSSKKGAPKNNNSKLENKSSKKGAPKNNNSKLENKNKKGAQGFPEAPSISSAPADKIESGKHQVVENVAEVPEGLRSRIKFKFQNCLGRMSWC